jgi:hypothetical protein
LYEFKSRPTLKPKPVFSVLSLMDKFPVTITNNDDVYHFEVVDYVHHSGDRCQFEVYLHGQLVASFEPDPQNHLNVCKNQGGLDEDVLHLLADEIESYDWE